MNKDNNEEKIKSWEKEEQMFFSGWDFSHIENRVLSKKLPWDYKKIIKDNLNNNMTLLDMGTGGGEFLLTLNHPYEKTFVTEGYLTNYEICLQKLKPLGIGVKFIKDDDKIEYEDNKFDIIINRHESFNVEEIKRVLKPQGLFITQQVGGLNDYDLSKRINPNFTPKFKENNLLEILSKFKAQGFQIIQENEIMNPVKFFDTGAFVYFAKIIEWEFPDFSVSTHTQELLNIEKEIQEKGYLLGTEHRYLLVAKNK
ncbi:MAG: class I SAM-dependent methyltransferase [Spirochaetia bacterium]|nr:class I SAM-dependent methyltransferase [Spirochaetia bacterium]